jgi:methylmalonyl-CoA mutase cobalamin-binding subunit
MSNIEYESAGGVTHPRRRSLVVLAAEETRASDGDARALAASLGERGIDALYLGREESARRIAASAAETRADAVELCVCGSGASALLRDLLRELRRVNRREVSIVVHKVA